jgi:transposase-like protein
MGKGPRGCQWVSVNVRVWRKLGRNKEAAVLALLSQRSVEEAARVAGIAPRTLYRWLKEPEFYAAYRAARRTAFSPSIARLQQGSSAAATTLLKLMLDPATALSTRARCSESVISFASKAIELEDIEARVSELERATEAPKDSRRFGYATTKGHRLRHRKQPDRR